MSTTRTEVWEIEDGNVYEAAVRERYTVTLPDGTIGEGRKGLVALVYGDHELAANGSRARLIVAAPKMLEHLYRLIAWIPPTPADYAEQGATAFTPEARYLIDAQNAARAILRDVEGTNG